MAKNQTEEPRIDLSKLISLANHSDEHWFPLAVQGLRQQTNQDDDRYVYTAFGQVDVRFTDKLHIKPTLKGARWMGYLIYEALLECEQAAGIMHEEKNVPEHVVDPESKDFCWSSSANMTFEIFKRSLDSRYPFLMRVTERSLQVRPLGMVGNDDRINAYALLLCPPFYLSQAPSSLMKDVVEQKGEDWIHVGQRKYTAHVMIDVGKPHEGSDQKEALAGVEKWLGALGFIPTDFTKRAPKVVQEKAEVWTTEMERVQDIYMHAKSVNPGNPIGAMIFVSMYGPDIRDLG